MWNIPEVAKAQRPSFQGFEITSRADSGGHVSTETSFLTVPKRYAINLSNETVPAAQKFPGESVNKSDSVDGDYAPLREDGKSSNSQTELDSLNRNPAGGGWEKPLVDTPAPLDYKPLISEYKKTHKAMVSSPAKDPIILDIISKYTPKRRKKKNGRCSKNTLSPEIQKFPSFLYETPKDDQEYDRFLDHSPVDDLEFLMKAVFFCHEGRSNFWKTKQEKFIEEAHSASELKMKLIHVPYNDHNIIMKVENPHNIPVKDMEKVLRYLAFGKLERFHVENAAHLEELEVILAETPTTGARTPQERDRLLDIIDRYQTVVTDLFEVAYNILSYNFSCKPENN